MYCTYVYIYISLPLAKTNMTLQIHVFTMDKLTSINDTGPNLKLDGHGLKPKRS